MAAVAFGGAVVFMLLGEIMKAFGAEMSERFPYISGGSFLLLYAVYNSIFSLNSTDLNDYWKKSIFAYVLLLVGVTVVAYIFSGIWINEAGTFRWIFSILSFGYLTFLSVMGMVKRVFLIIKKEDERMHGKWDK
jgi:hypothetical protein